MKVFIVSLNDSYVVDHGATEEEIAKACGTSRTLCGLKLKGVQWFIRGLEKFGGEQKYYCKRCCAALKKLQMESQNV